MKINKHHTYNRAACICIAACLLFLSALTACSGELEPEVMNEEWIPLEINIGSIKKLEVSPMSKAETAELPDFIRTEFKVGDELKLNLSIGTDYVDTSVFLQEDGSWKKADGTSLMLRPNTTYSIDANYGTIIDNFCTTDRLVANAIPTYDTNTKKYTCNFNFTRPSNWACLMIEFCLLDPGDPIGDEYVTFISAEFYYVPGNQNARKPALPITNNRIEGLYFGEFTAYGVHLECSHNKGSVNLLRFDKEDANYQFEVKPQRLTKMRLVYPYPLWKQ